MGEGGRLTLPWGHDRWPRKGFLAVLEAGSPSSRCQLIWLPADPHPGLQMAAFSLRPRRASSLVSPPHRGSVPIAAPPSRPHLSQITFQRPHLLTPVHWGQGFNT